MIEFYLMLFFVFFTFSVVALIVMSKKQEKQARLQQEQKKALLEKAWTAYHHSLELLKQDPRNADLRQETLRLGRVYSNLARNSKGVTVFDEVALMNDINTVCAGSGKNNGSPSLDSRLEKLADLKQKGFVTGAEYEERRRKLLEEI
jgi:hypothetical protein